MYDLSRSRFSSIRKNKVSSPQVLNQRLGRTSQQAKSTTLTAWASQRTLFLVVMLAVLALGSLLFLSGLGESGLVDETPPLFAASARHMAESGDLLIPRFNGLPRYDKPPLVYWLMAAGYALPGRPQWDPMGTWAANLPSALATIGMMLLLADTMMRWPQHRLHGMSRAVALPIVTALSFALSPLILIWGRTGVSDAVFTALCGAALILIWRRYASARNSGWWQPWFILGLAVLCKGPVAIILLGLTLLLFVALQGQCAIRRLRRRLRPLAGLAVTSLVAMPWYVVVLVIEGRPYWESFFVYHNLQRFSMVVNDHQQPAWYFLVVLCLAAIPFTPFLILGLAKGVGRLRWRWPLADPCEPSLSLGCFAACWLLAVLIFFSLAATKLPSYWLPATPAAAILISYALTTISKPCWRIALAVTGSLALVISAGLAAAPLWLNWIDEPTIPDIAEKFGGGPWFPLGSVLFGIAGILALVSLLAPSPDPRSLLLIQLPLVGVVPSLLLPLWTIGDQVRGAPLREIANAILQDIRPDEPLAMVGWMKPSLHYYTRKIVLYEGRSPRGMLNLVDRLRHDRRPGFLGSLPDAVPSLLVVINRQTLATDHWSRVDASPLTIAGPYQLLRVDRLALEAEAARLRAKGVEISWREFRAERW